MSVGRHGGRIGLEITPEIINYAIPRDSGHCLVAEALKEAIPAARWIMVDLQTIRWTEPESKKRYICFTPRVAQEVLVNWDLGVRPDPLAFTIRPVQIVEMNGSRRKQRPGGKNIETKKRIKNVEIDPRTGGNNFKPVVSGGPTPPLAALSNVKGRRREFGLRSLQR